MLNLPDISDWTQAIGQVVCCDCLDLMKLIPDKAIDLVLTDPPYGLNLKMQGGTWGISYRRGDMKNWDYTIKQTDIEAIINKGKNAIVWGANNYTMRPSRCWLVWNKPFFPTMSDVELAWTTFDKPSKSFGHNRIGNTNGHPTEKPLELMCWCLKNYSQENNLILDCFAGSFTTALAAEQLGRRWIACDISEKYCKIGDQRLAKERSQGKLF